MSPAEWRKECIPKVACALWELLVKEGTLGYFTFGCLLEGFRLVPVVAIGILGPEVIFAILSSIQWYPCKDGITWY